MQEVVGSFGIDKASLQLTPQTGVASVVLTNESASGSFFTVRKRRHVITAADGSIQESESRAEDPECNPMVNCPLAWLSMGVAGQAAQVQDFEVWLDGNSSKVIEFDGIEGVDAPAWDGDIEVISETLGVRRIHLTFVGSPDGLWSGHIYYLANFGTAGLENWASDQESRGNPDAIENVGNALVQRWASFRQGNISFDELMAVLQSVLVKSWDWKTVRKNCSVTASGGACYPYSINQQGVVTFSADLATHPIPSGVTELPFAAYLRSDSDGMSGRIDSTTTLQYPGNPAIRMGFVSVPGACDGHSGPSCLSFIDDMNVDIVMGGRYQTDEYDTECSRRAWEPEDGSYALFRTPWLIPGFKRMTAQDENSGLLYRYECRDTRQPFAPSEGETVSSGIMASNQSLAMANPLPDGRARKRHIRLLDGAVINQSNMFILFEERMESFFPGDTDGISAYGYIVLNRESSVHDQSDNDGSGVADVYEGSIQADGRNEPQNILDIQCSPEILAELGLGAGITPANAGRAVEALINGVMSGDSLPEVIEPGCGEEVHYLCGDTGIFDGGAGLARSCPAGSSVTYFTVNPDKISAAAIEQNPCMDNGTCEAVLNQWISLGVAGGLIQSDPVWRCREANAIYCDSNRLDLRADKEFFKRSPGVAVFRPIYSEIDSAFRYKTRFVGRTGTSVGFAPEICIKDSNQIPYCYDPGQIEHVRARVDCLLHVWRDFYSNPDGEIELPATARSMLDRYLCVNYANTEACRGRMSGVEINNPHDGFERLYSELLVMMGDEAYTSAFASRFDLAGSSGRAFEGAFFEEGGINLSGAAGFEMYSFYLAVQYYQEALDRFYSGSPGLWQATSYGLVGRNFVTPETATVYLDRLSRASSQKARAWSEIAKRYQDFNRPDLAKKVVERAYTSNYLETVILSRLMHHMTEILSMEELPQVISVLNEAQKRNSMALLDMRNVYKSLTGDVSHFGLSPDYIPFPVLGSDDDNAFEVLLARARQKLEVARSKEEAALERNTSFETDTQAFSSELVQLRNTYEGQLAQLCGTFEGNDGRIYPAIERYAELNNSAMMMGDPCGQMGTGEISSLMGQMEGLGLELRGIQVSSDNVLAEIELEKERVSKQCGLILDKADYVFEQAGREMKLSEAISDCKTAMTAIDRGLQTIETVASLSKCSIGTSTDCPSGAVAIGIYMAALAGPSIALPVLEDKVARKEADIMQIQRETARWEMKKECDAATIDSNAMTATLLLRMKELELEALRADYSMRTQLAEIRTRYNLARRISLEMEEAEQLAINLQAARSDPNVRIYRNDAIVNADITFEDAIKAAYKATKVYEYYTSQSYAELDKLFLIRMIQYGEYNLENYLTNLENDFHDFQEQYGRPDLRVAILSLRDSIFNIPRLDDDGAAISQADRIAMMRDRLADVTLLDSEGYLTISFSTDFQSLSPLTRNHKIEYIEVEMIGSDLGDTVGRIYLKQGGTSVVSSLEGEKVYYSFPQHTAVLNPYFNGDRVFGDDIYRSVRLRDRPYVNTSWDLVINQRDESVNQDIDLQSLTDIRFYVYYSDFTAY